MESCSLKFREWIKVEFLVFFILNLIDLLIWSILFVLVLQFHKWQEELGKQDWNPSCVTSWLLCQHELEAQGGSVCASSSHYFTTYMLVSFFNEAWLTRAVTMILPLTWQADRKEDRCRHILIAWRDVRAVTWKWSVFYWTGVSILMSVYVMRDEQIVMFVSLFYNEQSDRSVMQRCAHVINVLGCKFTMNSYVSRGWQVLHYDVVWKWNADVLLSMSGTAGRSNIINFWPVLVLLMFLKHSALCLLIKLCVY